MSKKLGQPFHWFFKTSVCSMGTADTAFNKAKDRLNTLKDDPENETKLKLYALFKQATVGKCNVPKPGMMDLVGKYKWSAWNDLGEMTQDEAKKAYTELVDSLVGSKEMSVSEVPKESHKFSTLIVSANNGIYSIVLNRPSKKNAITWQMYEEIISALKEASEDKSVVLATMTGAGDYYCSGNDLSNFMNINPGNIAEMAKKGGDVLERFVSAFIDFPKPLLALVNGPAVGISVTVLGLCDAVYASDKATFLTPFTHLGQSAEGCSSYLFPRLMGSAKASELLLFNKKISAAEAFNRNLITEVIPEGTFIKETTALVQAYAKLPKESFGLSKVLIRHAQKDILHSVNKEECRLLIDRWQSQECTQAIMNFFQQKSDSKL